MFALSEAGVSKCFFFLKFSFGLQTYCRKLEFSRGLEASLEVSKVKLSAEVVFSGDEFNSDVEAEKLNEAVDILFP